MGTKTIKAIEMFAGIGGFRLAANQLKVKVVWANDIDETACSVYRDNFGANSIVCGDINEHLKDIPAHDLLLAGFPCQPFSKAGKKMGVRDYRGTLFESIVHVLQERQPRFFMLENVSNLLSLDGGHHFQTVLSALSALNYAIEWKVFNASNLGLPQHRERIVIVGCLNSHITPSTVLLTPKEEQTLSDSAIDAILDTNNWREVSAICHKMPNWGIAKNGQYVSFHIDPEANVLPPTCLKDVLDKVVPPEFDFTEETKSRMKMSTPVNRYYNGVQLLFNQGGGARMGYTIFGPEGLAPTLTASTSRHYERYFIDGKFRRLTNTEYAKIQGFPADHAKAASVYDQYKLYGNAIPPILAQWVLQRLLFSQPRKIAPRGLTLWS